MCRPVWKIVISLTIIPLCIITLYLKKSQYNIVNHLSFPQSKNKVLSGYCQNPSQSSEKLHVFTVVKGWKPESPWSYTLRNRFNARKTSQPSTKNDGLKIMCSYLGNPSPDKRTDCIVFLIYLIYRTEKRGKKWAMFW